MEIANKISKSKLGKKLDIHHRIEYKCKNTACANMMKTFPSQLQKKYCCCQCRKSHREYIRINSTITSTCFRCGLEITTIRQKCGKLVANKNCRDCNKLIQHENVKNAKAKFDYLVETGSDFMKHKTSRHHTDETKRKIRVSSINYRSKLKITSYPNFNPKACEIIDEYGKNNGYNFQHAMNGGEYLIDHLGYFVDGYDVNKNVVIEVDEKYHNNKKQKEKDIIRQNEIQNFLRCEFIHVTM